MPDLETRTFSLPTVRTSYIDRLVSTGLYASAEDVVSAGLEALEDRHEGFERWLRQEAAPVVARMQAEPDRAIPIDDVFDGIRRLHRQRQGS